MPVTVTHLGSVQPGDCQYSVAPAGGGASPSEVEGHPPPNDMYPASKPTWSAACKQVECQCTHTLKRQWLGWLLLLLDSVGCSAISSVSPVAHQCRCRGMSSWARSGSKRQPGGATDPLSTNLGTTLGSQNHLPSQAPILWQLKRRDSN